MLLLRAFWRWQKELNTLQLKKIPANRQNSSKLRTIWQHVCCKSKEENELQCNRLQKSQSIEKMCPWLVHHFLVSPGNTSVPFFLLLSVLFSVFGYVLCICKACVVKLSKIFSLFACVFLSSSALSSLNHHTFSDLKSAVELRQQNASKCFVSDCTCTYQCFNKYHSSIVSQNTPMTKAKLCWCLSLKMLLSRLGLVGSITSGIWSTILHWSNSTHQCCRLTFWKNPMNSKSLTADIQHHLWLKQLWKQKWYPQK